MKTVLIVEDNADLGRILHRRFTNAHVAAEVITDGFDLLSRIRNRKEDVPDAMVLDLMLPNRSGHELLSMVKAVWPQTKVFIYSAHSEYRRMILPGTVERFFLKTDGVENLIAAVQASLHRQEPAGTDALSPDDRDPPHGAGTSGD